MKVTAILLVCLASGYSITAEGPASPGPIAFDDVCMREAAIRDNLSCPREDGVLECMENDKLCTGTLDCSVGDADEQANGLDCNGTVTGRTMEPIAAFVCGSGQIIELTELCDGVSDCDSSVDPQSTGGDDERTPLCENKCKYPYYGGCPYSRECEYNDTNVWCGRCRPGWVQDPNNSTGECLTALFGFSQPFYIVPENAGPLKVQIVLNTAGMLEEDIQVMVSIVNGSATGSPFPPDESDDFFIETLTLTFRSGSVGFTLQTFFIVIINDSISEPDEQFLLRATIINERGNFTPGEDVATATIIDDDLASFAFQFSTYAVIEATSSTLVCVVITNSFLPSTSIFITLRTEPGNGTATANADYVATTQLLSFGPGVSLLCTQQILISDDNFVENEESFFLVITSTDPAVTFPNGNTATVRITDDDELRIDFEELSYTTMEETLFTRMCLISTSGVPTNNDCIVNITLRSAEDAPMGTNPADLERSPPDAQILGTNQFIFGSDSPSRQCINITIRNSPEIRSHRVFQVQAVPSQPQACVVEEPLAEVIIQGQDIVMEFEASYLQANEANFVAEVCVGIVFGTFQTPTTISLRVQSYFHGNRTERCRSLEPTFGSADLFFPQGFSDFTSCAAVPLRNDDCVESTEILEMIAVPDNPNVVFINGNTANVSIIDDDSAEFNFVLNTVLVPEGLGFSRHDIRISNDVLLGVPMTVQVTDVEAVDATAMKGDDYEPVNVTVVFPVGAGIGHVISVQVTIYDDSVCEGRERIQLEGSVTSTVAYGFFTNQPQVVIDDNDECIVGFLPPLSLYVPSGNNTRVVCLNLSGQLSRSSGVLVIFFGPVPNVCSFTTINTTEITLTFEPLRGTECLTIDIVYEGTVYCELVVFPALESTITVNPDAQQTEIFINYCSDLSTLPNAQISYDNSTSDSALRPTRSLDDPTINRPTRSLNDPTLHWPIRSLDDPTMNRPIRALSALGTVIWPNGSVATYTCDEGYQLLGETDERTCIDSVWTGVIPTCVAIETTPLTVQLEVFAGVVGLLVCVLLAFLVILILVCICRKMTKDRARVEVVEMSPQGAQLHGVDTPLPDDANGCIYEDIHPQAAEYEVYINTAADEHTNHHLLGVAKPEPISPTDSQSNSQNELYAEIQQTLPSVEEREGIENAAYKGHQRSSVEDREGREMVENAAYIGHQRSSVEDREGIETAANAAYKGHQRSIEGGVEENVAYNVTERTGSEEPYDTIDDYYY